MDSLKTRYKISKSFDTFDKERKEKHLVSCMKLGEMEMCAKELGLPTFKTKSEYSIAISDALSARFPHYCATPTTAPTTTPTSGLSLKKTGKKTIFVLSAPDADYEGLLEQFKKMGLKMVSVSQEQ